MITQDLSTRIFSPRLGLVPGGSVPAGDDLSSIPSSEAVDGSLCWVENERALYQFRAGDTTTQVVPGVVAPADGGAGRWFQLAGSEAVIDGVTSQINLPPTSLTLLGDSTTGGFSANLPANPPTGTRVKAKNVGSANQIILQAPTNVMIDNLGPTGSYLLGGVASGTTNAAELLFDGTQWWIMNTYLSP